MVASRRDVGGREDRGRVLVKFFDVEAILMHFGFEIANDLCPLGLLKFLVFLPYTFSELGMGQRQFLALSWCTLLQKEDINTILAFKNAYQTPNYTKQTFNSQIEQAGMVGTNYMAVVWDNTIYVVFTY